MLFILMVDKAPVVNQQFNSLFYQYPKEVMDMSVRVLLRVPDVHEYVGIYCHRILKRTSVHFRAPSRMPSMIFRPKNSIGNPGSIVPSSLMSRFLMTGI